MIVNFSIPKTLERRVHKTMQKKGFASKAEFFRFAAIYLMDNLNQPTSLDEIIEGARQDYTKGNYKTFTSAKKLIKELKR